MFRKMEFLPTVIFLSIYKKIGIIRVDFFKLNFFLLPLALFSCCCIFHLSSTMLLSHAGTGYQTVVTQEICLSTSIISKLTAVLAQNLRPGGERAGLWGEHALLKGTHRSQLTKTQPGTGISITKAIGELQVTGGILHIAVSEFMYFTNLISLG